MTLQPIPGFKSLATHHCITGSMLHVYTFHGHLISEDMLLGLGAGLGFVYWHTKGTMPFLGGRANVGRLGEEGLEIAAGRRTGVQVERHHTSSTRKAEDTLLELLLAGKPAMLMVDMGYLPYFDLPQDFHFGGHAIVVAGYDEESSTVLVADRDRDLHAVPLEIIAKARGSTYRPFPPRNTWFSFNFNKSHDPFPNDVIVAISEVCTNMLDGPISNLGVRGIRKAAAQTLRWPDMMSKGELRGACFNTYIFIDAEGGTGGGLFRYMYARFLAEAAEITGEGHLKQAAQDLKSNGDLWQEVALAYKHAAESPSPGDQLQKTVDPMLEIADREEAIWSNLRSIIG